MHYTEHGKISIYIMRLHNNNSFFIWHIQRAICLENIETGYICIFLVCYMIVHMYIYISACLIFLPYNITIYFVVLFSYFSRKFWHS